MSDDFEDSESQSLDKSSDRAPETSDTSLARSLWEDLGSGATAVAERTDSAVVVDGGLDTSSNDIYGGDSGSGTSAAEALGHGDNGASDSGSAGKPPEGGALEDAQAAARAIHEACDGLGTDEDAIYKALEGKTPEQIKAMDDYYQKNYGRSLKEEFDDELSGSELRRAEELMKGTPAPERKSESGDASPEDLRKVKEDPEVKAQREKLESAVDAKYIATSVNAREFKEDMAAFEKRAAEGKMSPQEVAKTYEQLTKLLEAQGDKPTEAADRRLLAKDIIHQAANPKAVAQGEHSTCTVAALEARMYTTNPSAAAKMVTEVATSPDGQFKTADGHTVKMPPKDLKPHDDCVPMDGERSYASQVFQDTAANIKWEKQNAGKTPPGEVRFEQDQPNPKGKPPENGDAVMDYAKKPPVRVREDEMPGITSSDIEDINYQITGKHEKNLVLQNDQYSDGKSEGTKELKSAQDLKGELERAKAEGRMPLCMRVHTGNEPFFTDSGGGKAGGSGGWHIITITDYDKDTGKCVVQNQWGDKANHGKDNPVSAEQLYFASHDAKNPPAPDLPRGAGSAGDAGTADLATSPRVEAPPEGADRDAGEMGKAGDRSKDSGLGKFERADVTKDEQGRVTDYKLGDGTRYQIAYGDDGHPKSVTITPEGGGPTTFEKNKKGDWRNPSDSSQGLNYVSDSDGKITIRNVDQDITIGNDGSYEQKNWRGGKTEAKIDADGTVHNYTYEAGSGQASRPEETYGTETITKPGSHVSEVKNLPGNSLKGYELKDDQGHVTKVDVNGDGSATVTRGDHKVTYDKVERDAAGDLKFTNKDNSSLEMKTDGTAIKRDKDGHVSDITNSDGENTHFKYAGGKVTEVTVSDGQGNQVQKITKGVEVNDKDGNYTVALENGNKLERKADGTERTLDKDGKQIETEQDKLMAKFKHFTPEQQQQLRQDLADIDRMPEAQKKQIYESLWKIADSDVRNDKVKLSAQQARELVASTAHQIAHPESIQQGDKMTCVAANAEQTMAKNHPEVYADMVAKLATDGKYTTAGGKTIETQLDKDGHLGAKTDVYGQRSYASELFQNAATQLGMKEGDTYKNYPPGSPELNPRPAGVNPSTDTGERVVHADGSSEKFTGFPADKQADILNQLAPGDKYKATEPVASVADLEKALKQNGGTPLNVGIHLGQESKFTGMSGTEGASGSGYHAVNITHFDKGPPAMVYYENPAGGADHSYPNGKAVPADDFVKAMQGGDTKMRAVVKDTAGTMPKASDAKTAAGAMGNPNAGGDAGLMGNPNAQAGAKPDSAPDVAAREIHEATSGFGTDEAKIFKALEGKSPDQIKAIDDYYRKNYGTSLVQEMKDELVDDDLQKALKLIDPGIAAAELIHEEMSGLWTDEDAILKALEGKTPDQIKSMEDYYKKTFGKDLRSELKDELTADEMKKAETLMKGTATLDRAAFEKVKADEAAERVEGAKHIKESAEVKAEHEKLEKLAEKKIADPEERKQFLANMKTFEERAGGREVEYRKQLEAQGMKPDEAKKQAAERAQKEVVESFKNIERIMETNPKAPISEKDRIYLAEQAMQHAADPYSIAQGQHNTCNVTTIEHRTFTSDPASATKLIADMATTGSYTTLDSPPVTVKLDAKQLQKFTESKDPKKHEDGQRDYASQIFQVTAANVLLQIENSRTTPPGQLRYEQREPDPKVPGDTGERLLDYSKKNPDTGKPPLPVKDKDGSFDGVPLRSVEQVALVSHAISPETKGGKLDGVVAVDSGGLLQPTKEIVELTMKIQGIGDGKPINLEDPDCFKKLREAVDKKTGGDAKEIAELKKNIDDLEKEWKLVKEGAQAHVKSVDELKDVMAKARAEGKLPMVVEVWTTNEPFFTDSGAGAAGGFGGKHVVTITDYDPATGVCKMQNQWGRDSSHDIPVKQLFRSMHTPEEGKEMLEKEVAENRAKGPEAVDYALEYELIRKKHDAGKLTDREYDDELTRLALENFNRQNATGKFDDPAWHESRKVGVAMLDQIESKDPARAKRIRENLAAGIEKAKKKSS